MKRSFNKIFCIGFNKTGTSSLYKAIVMLGFNGIHGTMPNHLKVQKALQEKKPLLTYFPSKCVQFSDLDIIKDNFKLLDMQYLNSKFILHTRNKKDWLRSRSLHYNDYWMHIKKGTNKYVKGWRWVNETPEQWSLEWDVHHQNVLDYFKNRNCLLMIDIPKGDGFEKLCPFLNVPFLKKPFPMLNQTAERK